MEGMEAPRYGIDTITLTNRLATWDEGDKAVTRWERNECETWEHGGLTGRCESTQAKRWNYKDPMTALTFAVSEVYGRGQWPEYWARVEVSLPKWLWGHNVNTATTDHLRFFCKCLDQADLNIESSWCQANVSRVDMVCDLDRDYPQEWIQRAALTPAPFIRMERAVYENGVYWFNKSHLLRVYGKGQESGIAEAEKQIRIEYQCRKTRLRTLGVHYVSDLWEATILEHVGQLAARICEYADQPQDVGVELYKKALDIGCTQREAMLVMAASLLQGAGIKVNSRRTREHLERVRRNAAAREVRGAQDRRV